MRILSLHFGHDSSCCIYNNGVVEHFFLTERLTRKKHDSNIGKILKIISSFVKEKYNYKIDYVVISQHGQEVLDFENIKKLFNSKLIVEKEHHKNHALLSFFNSGFDESLVVVVDGTGCCINVDEDLFEIESVFLSQKNDLKLIYKNIVKFACSLDLPWDKKFKHYPLESLEKTSKFDYKNIFGIGVLYDIAAILISGSSPLSEGIDACGKAMGLSSYGEENENFKNIFLTGNTLNNNFYKNCSEEIKYFLKNPSNQITKENYKLHADFCYEVQIQTQKAVGDLIEKSIKKTGIKNVCISGGYGMNIVANHYYLQRFPDVQFYFEPLCNDSGLSIGSAISNYIKLSSKDVTIRPLKTTSFHGIYYDISEYLGKTTSVKDVANLLYQDKSVAVYTGLAEAGQRALGNRSILFNALNPDAKDLVNKIKKREWYRPFACIVLEEDANIYFDMGRIKSSPFMTVCFPVRPEYVKIIPGVTHVDNTCRIQTVSQTDGYLYELLQEFKKLTGYGILLNTSFNLAGEPLVETPINAFNNLNNSCLDYLWFEETQQLFDKIIFKSIMK
jgi:carbamoyltransferase